MVNDVAFTAVSGEPIHQGYATVGVNGLDADGQQITPAVTPTPTTSGEVITTYRDQYTDRFDDPTYYG